MSESQKSAPPSDLVGGIQEIIDAAVDRYRDTLRSANKAWQDADYDVYRDLIGAAGTYRDVVDPMCQLIGVDTPDWDAISEEFGQ